MWLRPALLFPLFLGPTLLFTILAPTEAQQAGKVYRIGVLGSPALPVWATFQQGLRDLGYVEGQSIKY